MRYLIDPICAENWDSFKQYKKFHVFNLYKGKYYRALSMLPHIAAVIFFLASALTFVVDYVTIFSLSMTSLAFFAYTGYLAGLKFVPEKMCINASTPRDSFSRYVFSNENILVITGREKSTEKKEIRLYSDIIEIYEFADDIYIYFHDKSVVFVDKHRFTAGTPEVLRLFLAGKIGDSKYYVLK